MYVNRALLSVHSADYTKLHSDSITGSEMANTYRKSGRYCQLLQMVDLHDKSNFRVIVGVFASCSIVKWQALSRRLITNASFAC